MSDLVLDGKFVKLVEVNPTYFDFIIKWRNDPDKNKFLNCPYKLNIENQTYWYNNIYKNDNTQGYLVCINKSDDTPFATHGWTDMDLDNKRCILGRLLLGDDSYSGSPAFLESFFIFYDYIYNLVDTAYIHVSPENTPSVNLNKRFGFIPNENKIMYPEELFVNGDKSRPQTEFYRTKEMYLKIRHNFYEKLKILN